jgi:hypothetical protein
MLQGEIIAVNGGLLKGLGNVLRYLGVAVRIVWRVDNVSRRDCIVLRDRQLPQSVIDLRQKLDALPALLKGTPGRAGATVEVGQALEGMRKTFVDELEVHPEDLADGAMGDMTVTLPKGERNVRLELIALCRDPLVYVPAWKEARIEAAFSYQSALLHNLLEEMGLLRNVGTDRL